MVKIDEQEVKIVRQLIRHPRISDNAIARATGIPVMTVNRKRKALEKRGLISYYTDFCHGERGTDDFNAKELYIVKFKGGISREQFLTQINREKKYNKFMSMYSVEAYLGEKDGRLCLIIILNGKTPTELVEVFNSTVIAMFREYFGQDAVTDILTARITDLLRTHHNYLPMLNMRDGTIRADWPDDLIFVSRDSYGLFEKRTETSDF